MIAGLGAVSGTRGARCARLDGRGTRDGSGVAFRTANGARGADGAEISGVSSSPGTGSLNSGRSSRSDRDLDRAGGVGAAEGAGVGVAVAPSVNERSGHGPSASLPRCSTGSMGVTLPDASEKSYPQFRQRSGLSKLMY